MHAARSLAAGVALLVLATFPVTSVEASDGFQWMMDVESNMRSEGEALSVRMDLVAASGAIETRTFSMWTASGPSGQDKSLIRFDQPASLAGTALLAVRRKSGGQDNWLYVPALDQVRRVAPADRSESFVGSDFAIEDLTTSVDNAARQYTILGPATPCGDRSCLQVEDRPRTEGASRASGYGRVVLHIDTEYKVAHRIDFYDKQGGLMKVLRAEGLVKAAGKWRFDRASLMNLARGTTTVMTVLRRAGPEAVDASVFSPSSLGSW